MENGAAGTLRNPNKRIAERRSHPCILCGEDRAATIHEYAETNQYEVFVGVERKNYYRAWLRCLGCGFCYSVFSRQEEVLDRLYESGYRDKAAPWRKGTV